MGTSRTLSRERGRGESGKRTETLRLPYGGNTRGERMLPKKPRDLRAALLPPEWERDAEKERLKGIAPSMAQSRNKGGEAACLALVEGGGTCYERKGSRRSR